LSKNKGSSHNHSAMGDVERGQGQIWQDSNNEERSRAAWYCAIDDYHRFPVAVPAKIDNATLENIPRNMWRDGVRVLEPGVYERIMKLAEGGAADAPSTASADDVQAIASESLIVPKRLLAPSSDNGPGKIYRVSRRAKEVGDWAEKVVTEYLMATIAGCTNCIHRPTLGETPGWDIDYLDSAGELQRVEVKGTTAAAFTGVEMTSNELDAAMKYKEAYWLYLVAACLTRAPKIQAIQNPAAMFDSGAWSARPALFSIRFLGSGTE